MIDGNVDLLDPTGMDRTYNASPNADIVERHNATLIVLNCALRNGNAHLKNFGIVYDDVQREARLAPFIRLGDDVRLPRQGLPGPDFQQLHRMAERRDLRKLGETRTDGSPAKIRQTLARSDQAVQEAVTEVRSDIRHPPEFAGIGRRMLQEWETAPILRCAVKFPRTRPAKPFRYIRMNCTVPHHPCPHLCEWRRRLHPSQFLKELLIEM